MVLWRRLLLVSCFCQSLSPAWSLAAENLTGSFETLRDNGEKAFNQNNYGLAERNFLAALKTLETEKVPAKDPRWARAYKNLADLYELRLQSQKSEFYLEKELRAREKALGSENPQVLACVGKLARFYLIHNNPLKADRLSGLLLRYAERVLKDEQQLDAHFAELQKFFDNHKEYQEPERKLKQARESAEKVRADNHLELAASLDSIAALYKEKSKYALAEAMYKRALELREKALAPGHQALAFGYENLANLYIAQGKTQLAQPLLQQSLEITDKALDFKRPELFSRLDSLARTYMSSGNLSEAESLYKRALTVMKENSSAGSKDYASASFALANLYMKQGKYALAEPLLKTALAINEGIYGPQSASIIPLLDAYAEALDKNSKSAEAGKIRHRANAIRGNTSACNKGSDSAANF
ncbi:MAG: tetratricopeptide repeat protein [Candidatus Obscuribacterales bacterium]|nr:tetratricopeptide repeat protein [Candidatus Obscuribacterales bacterium]